jgi:hypothetical protein
MVPSNDIERVSETGSAQRYRATPLRPAVWMTSVLVWATVVALALRVPTWASVFLCVVTSVSFLFYLVSYIYLMAKDREALRAERGRARSGAGSLRAAERSSAAWQPEQEEPVYIGPEGRRSVAAMTRQEAQKVRVSEFKEMVDE